MNRNRQLPGFDGWVIVVAVAMFLLAFAGSLALVYSARREYEPGLGHVAAPRRQLLAARELRRRCRDRCVTRSHRGRPGIGGVPAASLGDCCGAGRCSDRLRRRPGSFLQVRWSASHPRSDNREIAVTPRIVSGAAGRLRTVRISAFHPPSGPPMSASRCT